MERTRTSDVGSVTMQACTPPVSVVVVAIIFACPKRRVSDLARIRRRCGHVCLPHTGKGKNGCKLSALGQSDATEQPREEEQMAADPDHRAKRFAWAAASERPRSTIFSAYIIRDQRRESSEDLM
jgi:hypothetical protein